MIAVLTLIALAQTPEAPVRPASPPRQSDAPYLVSKCSVCTALPPVPNTPIAYLTQLTRHGGDDVLARKTREIRDAHFRSLVALYGGVALSLAPVITLFALPNLSEHCEPGAPGCFDTTPVYFALSGAILAAGVVAYVALAPREPELVEVLNSWNAQHPDQVWRPGDLDPSTGKMPPSALEPDPPLPPEPAPPRKKRTAHNGQLDPA